jgi:hypothetical protein
MSMSMCHVSMCCGVAFLVSVKELEAFLLAALREDPA